MFSKIFYNTIVGVLNLYIKNICIVCIATKYTPTYNINYFSVYIVAPKTC